MSSEESHSEFAMRSRTTRTFSDGERRRESPTYRDTVVIERRIKPGDTLNKLSIQYAVNVADIKRANNLVNDMDFGALKRVKIPISKMRHALGVGSSSEDEEHVIDVDDQTRLLQNGKPRDASVEELFNKTDSVIAQVRETLPEDGVPGSFHFVDARPPDSGCTVWALLAGVVVMFMIIPLLLTFYEENESEEYA